MRLPRNLPKLPNWENASAAPGPGAGLWLPIIASVIVVGGPFAAVGQLTANMKDKAAAVETKHTQAMIESINGVAAASVNPSSDNKSSTATVTLHPQDVIDSSIAQKHVRTIDKPGGVCTHDANSKNNTFVIVDKAAQNQGPWIVTYKTSSMSNDVSYIHIENPDGITLRRDIAKMAIQTSLGIGVVSKDPSANYVVRNLRKEALSNTCALRS